jgi:hypothetical protein
MILVSLQWKRLAALPLCGVLLACGCSSQPPSETKTAEVRPAPPVIRNRAADDVGRFLAGLPGKPGSPFADLEQQPVWQEHQRELDKMWGAVETKWLPNMTEFKRTELSDPPIKDSVVFYPFSGPDVLVLTIFFPNNANSVMVALEPAGALPNRARIEKRGAADYLAGIREAVYSELHRSFFITREMDRNFRGEVTDGLLPPILLLLTRSHHTILDCRYVRLDDQGNIIERALGYKAPGKIGNKGVEIEYASDADNSIHKLYYFSVNLDDNHLKLNKPFLAYLSGLKGMTTYFKATSYMTHQKGFSMICDQVLAGSAAVLQDDSGIPYKYFKAAPWQVQLYGEYEKPYEPFGFRQQPDLRAAYRNSKAKPLSFRIGYGFAKIPSNLLLATRAGSAAR